MTTTEAYRIPNSAKKATGLVHNHRLPGSGGVIRVGKTAKLSSGWCAGHDLIVYLMVKFADGLQFLPDLRLGSFLRANRLS